MPLNNWIKDLELEKLQKLFSSSVAPTAAQLGEEFPELSQAQLVHLESMAAGSKKSFQADIAEAFSGSGSEPEQEQWSVEPEQAQEDGDEELADFAETPVSLLDASDHSETLPQIEPEAKESQEDDEWSFAEDDWGVSLPEINPKDFKDVPLRRFAPYKFESGIVPVSQVKLETDDAEDRQDPESDEEKPYGVFLYWDDYETDAAKVLYRVVAADREEQLSPEAGTTLACTVGNAYREELPEDAGLRVYRVWAYPGNDPLECISQQPKLMGEQVVIAPPRDFKIVETNGTVSGTWTPMRGHTAIKLFVREHGSGLDINDPQNERRDATRGREFSCENLQRGKTYDFQIIPVVEYENNQRIGSGSKIIPLTISANIQAVEIIEAIGLTDTDGNTNKISLKWVTPPSGEVKIYLTNEPPKPDIIGRPIENNYIEDDMVLSATDYVKAYDENTAGEIAARLLDWPVDWDRVFCTPVNVVGDKSMVGDFKVVSRVAEIKDYTLHERVSSQLITFDWPKGAGYIDIVDELGNVTKQLLEKDYRRQGGVRLELEPLASSFFLVPKSVYAGEETVANQTEISYQGRKVFQYAIQPNFEVNSLNFWVWRQGLREIRPPRFQVIFNERRLPLSLRDGEKVSVYKQRGHDPLTEKSWCLDFDDLEASDAEAYSGGNGMHWVLDPGLVRPGFYRMFIVGEGVIADGSQIMVDPESTDSLYQSFQNRGGYSEQ